MAGDERHRETLPRAAQLAIELGDGKRAARAALANDRGFNSSAQGVDRELVAILEAAIELLGDDDVATRARLLARLAVELVEDEDWRRRTRLSDAALALARRVDDPATLAEVLTQHAIAQWRPDTLVARTAHMRESLLLADAAGARLVGAHAAHTGCHMAMESGDFERADALLARLASHTAQLRQPILEWFHAIALAKRCVIVGSPQDAERLAFAAFAVGQRAEQPDALMWLISQLFVARLVGGTLDEGEPNLPLLFGIPGSAPPAGPEITPSRSLPRLVSAATSVVMCEVGRPEDARAHFDLVTAELSDLTPDYSMLAILSSLAIACAHLREREVATRRARAPRAVRGTVRALRRVVAGGGRCTISPCSRRRRRASTPRTSALREAERAYTRLAAVAWVARCRVDWARMLLERGVGDDTERASALAAGALATAHELDLRKVAERATGLLALAGTRV